MRQKTVIIHGLILFFLIQGCRKANNIVFELEQEVPNTSFIEEDLYYSQQIILNALVAKNNILLLNIYSFSNFTADGERNNSSNVHSVTMSYFKKQCISKNYVALTPASYGDHFIQFYSTDENDFFYEEIGLNINKVGGVPGDSTLDYAQYNTSPYDNSAINEFDQAILPVIKKADTAAIVFILFDLRELIGSTNSWNFDIPYNPLLNLPKEKYTEIVFPQELTNKINRIESFRQNFYVSTAENTYLIRPDGSFRLLMEGSAADFFEYDGKIYGDFGDRIAYTPDDGETWIVKSNIPVFPAFREFQDVYGHLVFFHEDDLYLVDPIDFSFSALKNKGLEGSKITAVLPFYQRIYVATLSGLFHKPIEALEL